MGRKKGISSILTTIFFILIVVVAIAIIGLLLKQNLSGIDQSVVLEQIKTDCAAKYSPQDQAYGDCIKEGMIKRGYNPKEFAPVEPVPSGTGDGATSYGGDEGFGGYGGSEYMMGTTECIAVREMPAIGYNPNVPFVVKINVTFADTPAPGQCGGAVMETVPAGWNVTKIRGVGNGVLDVLYTNRTIRWAPIDGPACVDPPMNTYQLNYTVTPNATQKGTKYFTGLFSVDGSPCRFEDKYITQFGGGTMCDKYKNYSDWMYCKFTENEIKNSLIVGMDSDYDRDGIVNFVEYALGLDPHQKSTVGAPYENFVDGYFVMTYPYLRNADDISYVSEVKRCLMHESCPWLSGSAYTAISSIIDTGDRLQMFKVKDVNSASFDTINMRLRITKKSTPQKNYFIDAPMTPNSLVCGNTKIKSGEACLQVIPDNANETITSTDKKISCRKGSVTSNCQATYNTLSPSSVILTASPDGAGKPYFVTGTWSTNPANLCVVGGNYLTSTCTINRIFANTVVHVNAYVPKPGISVPA